MTITIKQPDKDQFPDISIQDVITHNFAPAKFMQYDRELFQTKWWDYRFMTPIQATLEYIDTFGREARKIYSRDIDYERAQHINVVSGEKIMAALMRNEEKAKRAFSGFWRGRQVADAIGIPYETYIYEAMSNRMRRWQRAYLPSAQQIYQEGDVERVMQRWEDLKASRIHYAEHHAYLAQNYCGCPVQIEYSDYLVKQASTTADKIDTITRMVEFDRLSVEYLNDYHDGIFQQVRHSLS